MNKAELRIWAKKTRETLEIKKLSVKLSERLTSTNEYKNAKRIMLFYPLKYEIDLLTLLKDTEKRFYLPKIEGNNLLCCPYGSGDATCLSCFNTCEPMTEPCEKNLIDMVIVPALAADKNCFRLGYGGGFYDRFLKDFTGIKVVCIPSKLVVETIYPEKHDIKMDLLITEQL